MNKPATSHRRVVQPRRSWPMGRRSFLQSMLLAPPLLAGLCRGAGAGEIGRPLLLVCDRATAGADPAQLRAFLGSFSARKLKLGLVVGGAAADMMPLAAVAAQTDPDLVEWIIDHPPLLEDLTYFQMRQASAAQEAFTAFRALSGVGATNWGACLSVTCRQSADAAPALEGVRAAGFRNVLLRPEADKRVESWTTDNGVLQLMGGRRARLSNLEPLFAAINERDDAGSPMLVYLGLDELTSFSTATSGTSAGMLADAIATAMYDGRIIPMLPSEFHLARFGAQRLIGLHFDLAGDADSGLPPLLQSLADAGVAFSSSGAGVDGSAAACARLAAAPNDAEWQGLRTILTAALVAGGEGLAAPQACVVTERYGLDLNQAIAETGAAAVVSTTAESSQATGLDGDGLLHIPASLQLREPGTFTARIADSGLNRGSGRLRDALVLVHANVASGQTIPQLDGGGLATLSDGEESKVVGLQGLARGIVALDPIFELLKRATAEDFIEAPEAGAIDAAERDLLIADAQLAWRYFTRFSNRRSGLALSSVQAEGRNVATYPLVTMWEIGSQILATIAALRIGIIDEPTFASRISALLKSIPASRIGDLVLPQSSISANRTPQEGESFSASDTGRLLVALKVLEQDFGMKDQVAKLVSRWDLASVTAEGRLHDVESGRLKEYSNSNYVDYAARGFALFGYETRSPYEVGTAETGTDRQMRLLNRVALLGPIATEPHVLETLELGDSEASRLISKLLFAAQFGAYQATGRLYCVSEAPLDRDPWFTYQGFRLGAKSEPWTIEATVDATAYRTEDFRSAVQLISAKAAYAWAAARPHPYSRKLLATVRAGARIPDLGFATGIYAASGRSTENYSDTNTNAVILEAIAYMLSGRKPALRL